MLSYKLLHKLASLALILVLFILAGCVRQDPQAGIVSPMPSTPQVDIPILPSATSAPLAVRVNGAGVLLVDYQTELARLQQALAERGEILTEKEQQTLVLDKLIESTLLAQEAATSGFSLDDAAVKARLDELTTELGGSVKLLDWMNKYGYDDASLLRSLKLAMLAAWGRDKVTSSVGDTAEQVHARQIRVSNKGDANSYYAQLQAGMEFATLAAEVDPLTGGELGWFPKGYLLQPELNDVVFTLNPGEYSQVIQTQIGYHIVQVIERDPQHPLTKETRLFLQHRALENWLETQKAIVEIEILVP